MHHSTNSLFGSIEKMLDSFFVANRTALERLAWGRDAEYIWDDETDGNLNRHLGKEIRIYCYLGINKNYACTHPRILKKADRKAGGTDGPPAP